MPPARVLLPLDLGGAVPPDAGDATGEDPDTGLCTPAGVPGLEGRVGVNAFGRSAFSRCRDLIGNFVLLSCKLMSCTRQTG